MLSSGEIIPTWQLAGPLAVRATFPLAQWPALPVKLNFIFYIFRLSIRVKWKLNTFICSLLYAKQIFNTFYTIL